MRHIHLDLHKLEVQFSRQISFIYFKLLNNDLIKTFHLPFTTFASACCIGNTNSMHEGEQTVLLIAMHTLSIRYRNSHVQGTRKDIFNIFLRFLYHAK